jgi:hypothetical protein
MGDDLLENGGDIVEEILNSINKRRWEIRLTDIYVENILYGQDFNCRNK